MVENGGLFLLLIAFCAGGCGIGLKMYAEGIAGISILAVLQFIVSGGLVAYVSWVFKVTVERYLYGGLSFDRVTSIFSLTRRNRCLVT